MSPEPATGSRYGKETGQRTLSCSFLGRVAYEPTLAMQESLRRAVQDGRGEEQLLLLEHEAVFTLGRNADATDVVAGEAWLLRHGVEVQESNRGGQVTYHGPGQLVGYPIIDLKPDRRDVRRYVRDLQEVLLRTLADHGIGARRREGQDFIGVWVGERKIASIGVHLSRWVTLHGFALNVDPNLSHFAGIVPCGLSRVEMTSIRREAGRAPSLRDLAESLAVHFGEIFDRRLSWLPEAGS